MVLTFRPRSLTIGLICVDRTYLTGASTNPGLCLDLVLMFVAMHQWFCFQYLTLPKFIFILFNNLPYVLKELPYSALEKRAVNIKGKSFFWCSRFL